MRINVPPAALHVGFDGWAAFERDDAPAQSFVFRTGRREFLAVDCRTGSAALRQNAVGAGGERRESPDGRESLVLCEAIDMVATNLQVWDNATQQLLWETGDGPIWGGFDQQTGGVVCAAAIGIHEEGPWFGHWSQETFEIRDPRTGSLVCRITLQP